MSKSVSQAFSVLGMQTFSFPQLTAMSAFCVAQEKEDGGGNRPVRVSHWLWTTKGMRRGKYVHQALKECAQNCRVISGNNQFILFISFVFFFSSYVFSSLACGLWFMVNLVIWSPSWSLWCLENCHPFVTCHSPFQPLSCSC